MMELMQLAAMQARLRLLMQKQLKTQAQVDSKNLQYVDFTGIDVNTNEVVGFRLISRMVLHQ